MKKRIEKAAVLLLVFLCLSVYALPQQAYAAYTAQETKIYLIDQMVGRYRLNYTGNTNHFALWYTNGTTAENYIYNDVPGYANSSTGILSSSAGASGIRRAFLVWETRAPAGASTPVVLRCPNGRVVNISPQYAINDLRLGVKSLYCMAADVTEHVKSAGYGSYTVCNIPRWDANDSWVWDDYFGWVTLGGESPGSWQLIVVEEGESFPVRGVSLSMGAEARLGGDYSGTMTLGNGLQSKTSGNVTGQIFFGASCAGVGHDLMTETITAYDSSGRYIGQAVSNTTSSSGLYRNGVMVNSRDYDKGCIRMDLSEVNGIGNGASRFELAVKNTAWSSFFFLGASVDIACPEFIGEQTTTVNSATSVTVTGKFTNTAVNRDTGIYNGNLTVTLDSGLKPASGEAVVNGVDTVAGTVSGQTVTFSGSAVASMMNGSSVTYTVECTTDNSGKARFDNSAGFHGYLRSEGVNTGWWIDRMWTADSYGTPKYTVTLHEGYGVASVSGAGEYSYGSRVDIGAVLKTGFHWKGWMGNYTATKQNETFLMPAENIELTAEGEANSYTITFDPNGGGETAHPEDLVAQYDAEVILPDGGAYYVKYTLDGVNITEEALAGAIMPDAEENGDEWDEELDEEPLPDKRAYESVYMGWSLEENRLGWEPQWTPGEIAVSEIARAAGAEDEDGVTITLYAVWDDSPWIQAMNLYYTLGQAQSGFITQEEILGHATAFDREDGSPIEAGEHENGTSFVIPDYQPTDFTQFSQTGSCTENLTVTDSVGSVYAKQITVYVVDTSSVAVTPEATTRFITEYYYDQPYEKGGLEEDSLWKTDPDYVSVLRNAFANIKNDAPAVTYHFTHDQILEMKRYVEEHGVGHSKEPNALRGFYDRFVAPGQIQ